MPNFEFTDQPRPETDLGSKMPEGEINTTDGITADHAPGAPADIEDRPPDDVDDLSVVETNQLAHASAEKSHSPEPTYTDRFIAEHTDAIRDKMDAPEGVLATTRESGAVDELSPRLAEMIDNVNDEALGRLGLSKDDLRTVAASMRGGLERSSMQRINVPNEVSTEGSTVHTELGDFEMARNPATGENVMQLGNYSKREGTLWLVPSQHETKYPDPDQRREAAVWNAGHEAAHSVVGNDLINAVADLPGQRIQLPDGTITDTTTYLRSMVAETFPAIPLTDYSQNYRQPDGSLPDVGEAIMAHIRAIEEEMCETVAATLCGFAPTPGRDPQAALDHPFEGREDFQRRVWDYMRATAA